MKIDYTEEEEQLIKDFIGMLYSRNLRECEILETIVSHEDNREAVIRFHGKILSEELRENGKRIYFMTPFRRKVIRTVNRIKRFFGIKNPKETTNINEKPTKQENEN